MVDGHELWHHDVAHELPNVVKVVVKECPY